MSKVSRLLLCLVIMLVASMSALGPNTTFAKTAKESKEENKEEVVYATQRGKKYHKADCRSIKNRETVSMSKTEAEEEGLEPCGRCFKEEEAEE